MSATSRLKRHHTRLATEGGVVAVEVEQAMWLGVSKIRSVGDCLRSVVIMGKGRGLKIAETAGGARSQVVNCFETR